MKLFVLLPGSLLLTWTVLGSMVQASEVMHSARKSRFHKVHAEHISFDKLRSYQTHSFINQADFLLKDQESVNLISQLNQQNSTDQEESDTEEEEIVVEGRKKPENSAPIYEIPKEEIEKQGTESVTEILRSAPGFAINDTGFGADIHTGFYYRGTTLNQNTFLLNGRPIGSNVNIYHGTTDLNTLLSGGIERIEISSGTASTLYGSDAFGGVVNIITREGNGPAQFTGVVQAGSYGQQNYRAGVSGSSDALSYAFGYERYRADNNYAVPVGAANRGPDGRLFNGDVSTDNFYGRLSYQVDPRNTLKLDTYTVASRKGLLYFGFPLQRDRLDHDGFNLGVSWSSLIGNGDDSILTATLGYNRDYFNTYGPTQTVFFRQGTLDSQGLTARVEHNWQVLPTYNVRYGLDLRSEFFDGLTVSNVPQFIALNGRQDRDRTNTALFVLNTLKIVEDLQLEVGLRQNFNSQYSSSTHPSVGIRWDATSDIAVRGSWVSVRRNPGLDQLFLFDTVHNWIPNPNLKPEFGSAWTAGVDLKIAPSVSAQLTYFGNSLEDRLGVVAGRWENIGLVNTNGFEAGVRWKITPQVSALINYTYTDARIASGIEKGLQLSTVPFSVAQLGVGYESDGWQVNLYANYNSGSRRALFTGSGSTNLDFSPSWLNLDLNARIPVLQNIALLIYLENLADVSYEKVNRIYQPGFTFRVGISATF